MPELFEVNRIKQYLLEANIINVNIKSVAFQNQGERILKQARVSEFYDLLVNNQIKDIKTKAKYTLICLETGSVLLHYRFTGIPHINGLNYGNRLNSIYSLPIINLNSNHVRFSIHFSNGQVLNYYDTRCLSHMHIHEFGQCFMNYDHLKSLSTDLLSYQMPSYKEFKAHYNLSKLDLKTFLLDQTKPPSGIGNYLANEICAHSNLNPWLKISALSSEEFTNLTIGMQEVINHCEQVSNYNWFKVFNRTTCRICNKNVIKQKHKKNSQSTFYCPSCQK